MLPEFKKRIDTLRDILVGAVPSPAGQIEQITYALIYKFMSDIDDRAASLPGGKRTYFTGEYEKYGWHELMTSTLGAHDRLTLYREALGSLARNPGLPELFQGIYQNAYLTFNDPRVLTLFLKEIDNFKHSNSDDIGDAYEYLLQITGAQGDVGQFRTPRHIIKFIVEAVNPIKSDSVLDPAVGTAGFLIAAYNHVKHHHDGVDEISGLSSENEQRLTSDELDKLHKNYHGFDIDPTMVRTAKVNMYLHGFKTPDIKNHDSLSSEDFWNERYDIILANPPFMSPKGGIKPHDKFGIVANRAEVLFVDYIASHLKPTGRAGIVVPEGIIFQSGKAYKELRKNLVDNYLYAVVSLPAGVFQPYSGVKTSVLLLDKDLAKQNDKVLFVKIENDGYSISTQRRRTTGDQFPEALSLIEKYRNGEEINSEFAHTVSRKTIASSSDYNLSGDRYKDSDTTTTSDYLKIKLGDKQYFEIESGGTPSSKELSFWGGDVNWVTLADLPQNNHITHIKDTQRKITTEGLLKSSAKMLPKGTILVSSRATIGRIAVADVETSTNQGFKNIIVKSDEVIPEYIANVLTQMTDKLKSIASGGTFAEFSKSSLEDIEIPLPSIETQRKIIADLDGYQKIISAAQTIIKTYKPTVVIDPEWPTKTISEISSRITKGTTPTTAGFQYQETGINFIKVESILGDGTFIPSKFAHIDDACHAAFKRSQLDEGDVLFSIAGALGRVSVVRRNILPANTNQALCIIKPTKDVISDYLAAVLRSEVISNTLDSLKTGVAQSNLSLAQVSNFEIPLPPIEIQHKIIAELKEEQRLIDANKALIQAFQKKISDKINEIWSK